MTTRQARWVSRRRAERVAAGRCHGCGATTDGYRCAKCREIAAAWQRKRKAARVL